jgi:threonylcarbamoyladenosine tRNA methylthiotransferase MtaB
MPKAALHTVGCKLNQYETEAIRERFELNGYEIVPFSSVADVYVVNTCTVTAKSDRSSRQAVYQALRQSRHARVVATGCSVDISPQSFERIEGIDLVVGNEGKGRIVDYICGLRSESAAQIPKPLHQRHRQTDWLPISSFRNYSRAFIKIQDGCNARCSYCVVPFARGRQRSRPLESIIAQAHDVVASGHQEIVLTGIHIGAYGADGSESICLVDVLQALVTVEGLWRIRLSSIEPRECTPELIEFIASSPKICRHLHIPLQSGDDEILKKMKRNYTSGDFEDLVNSVVTAIPGVGIGTDIIVGFPGETDGHFEKSYEYVKDLPLSYLHVFSYSERPGTAAAAYPDQVSDDVKKVRSSAFRRLRWEKILQFQEKSVGTSLQVLLERRRDRESGLLTGLSDNYIRALIDGGDHLQGHPVEVNVVSSGRGRVYGSLARVI